MQRTMQRAKKTLQQIFFERSTLLEEENGHFAFLRPLWELGTTYVVYLRRIGKLVVDFLLVTIERFSLDLRAEALRANID